MSAEKSSSTNTTVLPPDTGRRTAWGRFAVTTIYFRKFSKALKQHPRSILVIIFAAIAISVWWFALPKPLFSAPYSTVIDAQDGTLLGARIADDGQWRFPPTHAVPPRFSQALIEYEDRHFNSHFGIDWRGVARAMKQNISNGRIVSGASTLSMQVIRLARGRDGNRFVDKLTELALAPRLEMEYSKEQILSLYATHAPFGGNVIGLEAASWRYFGRDASQLSWAEACTLAVLPNSPALIHPGRSRASLLAKRNRLLQRLHDNGTLSDLDLKLAISEPLVDAPKAIPQFAPHLLATLHTERPSEARIITTLNAQLQRAANDIVAGYGSQLAKQDIHNAALIVIDNKSMEVRAYVGNTPPLSRSEERGHAVDIIHRPRSTGSILKPFLYAAMLESGDLLPHMLIPDVPTQIAGYMPENFDKQYRGAVPADVALAQSLNVPAVRMLRTFGVSRFYDSLTQMGMTTLKRTPDDYGLTLVLGGAEGNLWDIASGYANLTQIARDTSSTSVAQWRGTKVVKANASIARASADIGAASAWLTLTALLEVARPHDESQWREFTHAHPIAWKTGTSWGLRDAWAVGSSARYTVGVWVGNASGEGRPGLTGATAAAPILFDVFRKVDDDVWIPAPRWDFKQVQVCANDGYLVSGDCISRVERVPRAAQVLSNPRLQSPHNLLVHLDASARYRVDSSCERVSSMSHRSWFVLPPAQEYFYRRTHPSYKPLPAMRADCLNAQSTALTAARGPIEFLYPQSDATGDARVYIPVDFGSQRGRVVFEAVHRDVNAVLHWHIDQHYLGHTQLFHQMELDLEPGRHLVTVVDQSGALKSRRFTVLGVERTAVASPTRVAF